MTLPRATISIGITVIFMFHSFFNSLTRSRYLFFLLSINFILRSGGTAKSTIQQVLFFLFVVIIFVTTTTTTTTTSSSRSNYPYYIWVLKEAFFISSFYSVFGLMFSLSLCVYIYIYIYIYIYFSPSIFLSVSICMYSVSLSHHLPFLSFFLPSFLPSLLAHHISFSFCLSLRNIEWLFSSIYYLTNKTESSIVIWNDDRAYYSNTCIHDL